MKKLGINIDHVATLRNARGEIHPDPVLAAKLAIKYGADSITIHLREDRRHIKYKDLLNIKKLKNVPINLEIAPTYEMLKIALNKKPNFVCIVPEKRKEITTEGGLNLSKNKKKLLHTVNSLNKKKIRTSLFINANLNDVILAKNLGTKCIELHTGKISSQIKKKQKYLNELKKIVKCAKLAKSLGLEVHAGHGIDFKTAKILSKIKYIKEFNIGHFIIGESIFNGFKNIIKKFRKIIK
tara:strand:- start:72 stop:788 length:717 start_codon:yes stop_codon:yes gene_type:complete